MTRSDLEVGVMTVPSVLPIDPDDQEDQALIEDILAAYTESGFVGRPESSRVATLVDGRQATCALGAYAHRHGLRIDPLNFSIVSPLRAEIFPVQYQAGIARGFDVAFLVTLLTNEAEVARWEESCRDLLPIDSGYRRGFWVGYRVGRELIATGQIADAPVAG